MDSSGNEMHLFEIHINTHKISKWSFWCLTLRCYWLDHQRRAYWKWTKQLMVYEIKQSIWFKEVEVNPHLIFQDSSDLITTSPRNTHTQTHIHIHNCLVYFFQTFHCQGFHQVSFLGSFRRQKANSSLLELHTSL